MESFKEACVSCKNLLNKQDKIEKERKLPIHSNTTKSIKNACFLFP